MEVMAEVTNIQDRMREGRKARVNSLARGGIAYLNKVDEIKAQEAEKNETVRQCQERLDLAIRYAYARLSEGEAKLLIDMVHIRVRQTSGVE